MVLEFIGAAVAVVVYWMVRPENENSNCNVDTPVSKLVSELLGTSMLVPTLGLNVLNGYARTV